MALGEVSNQSHVIGVGMNAKDAFDTINLLKTEMQNLTVAFGKMMPKGNSGNNLRDILNSNVATQKEAIELQKKQEELSRKIALTERERIKNQIELQKHVEQLSKQGVTSEREKIKISQEQVKLEKAKLSLKEQQQRILDNQIKKEANLAEVARKKQENELRKAVRNQEVGYSSSVDSRKIEFQIAAEKSRMNQLLALAGDHAKGIQDPMKRLPVDIRNASNTMKRTLLEDFKQANRELMNLDVVKEKLNKPLTFMQDFGEKFGKITKWMTAVWALMATRKALMDAKDTIFAMQVAMIDLEKVMSHSTTNFQEMRQAAFDLGQELGRLPEEAARAMFLFARQGKEQAEVVEMTRTALMASNITDMNLEQSVKYLTAATLQLGVDAKGTMAILDSWNEVSNKNAVSAEQLAEAFSHTASVAKNLGMDIHDVNSLVTILAANTGKSGGEIGRSLRTSLQRAHLPEVQGLLASVAGISVYEPGTGNIRDLGLVLNEVADSWDNFSDAQRNAIAKAFGGQRHINDMIIIFENLNGMGLKVAEESMNSFGSSARENAKYMQSLERQIDSMSSVLRELFVSIGDSGILSVLETGIDIIKLVVGAFNNLWSPLKQVAISFALVKLGGIALNHTLGEYVPLIKTAALKSFDFVKAQVATQKSLVATNAAVRVGSASMATGTLTLAKMATGVKALGVALYGALGPWTMLAGGVIAAATVYQSTKKYIDGLNASMQANVESSKQTVAATEKKIKTLKEVRSAIQDIEQSTYSEVDAQEKKQKALSDFNSIMPGILNNYDMLKNRIDGVIDAHQREYEWLEKASQSFSNKYVEHLKNNVNALDKQLEGLNKTRDLILHSLDTGNLSFAIDWMNDTGIKSDVGHFTRLWAGAKALLGDSTPLENIFWETFKNLGAEIESTTSKMRSFESEISRINSVKAASGESGSTGIAHLVDLYGQYGHRIQEIVANNIDLYNSNKTVTEYIQSQADALKDTVGAIEKYFDTTGRGIEEYARIVREMNESMVSTKGTTLWSENDLFTVKNKEARDFLSTLTEGSEEYYAVLQKIIEAEDHFTNSLSKKRDALNRAFDTGAIGAVTFYSELARIDDLQVFEKKRQEIRKMNEELRSGTTKAIEQAFGAMIRGEDDVLEKFNESINNLQSNVLAKGLTDFVETSDYFRLTMSRQQNAIATLFGGQTTKEMSLDEKMFLVEQEQKSLLEVIAGNTEPRIDAITSAAISTGVASAVIAESTKSRDIDTVTGAAVSIGQPLTNEEPRLVAALKKIELPAPNVVINDKYKDIELSPERVNLLARLLAAEVGGEPLEGQLAALGTIFNRIISDKYPGTVEGVVRDPRQYQPITEGKVSSELNVQATDGFSRSLLREMTQLIFLVKNSGEDYSGGALNFFNPDISSKDGGDWHMGQSYYGTIGRHTFSSPPTSSDFDGVEWGAHNTAHTITSKRGDNLWNWSREYGVSEAAIQAINNMGDSTVISRDKEYKIPSADWINENIQSVGSTLSAFNSLNESAIKATADITTASYHIVKAGDTAWDLAKAWGTTVALMEAVNPHIKDIGRLGIGNKIYIPDGATNPPKPFSAGGHTGGNSKNKIAGVVHEDEWVAPQWMLKKYPDIISNLENIRTRGFQSGGFTSKYGNSLSGMLDSNPPTESTNSSIESNLEKIEENTRNIDTKTSQQITHWESLNSTFPGVAQSITKVNREIGNYMAGVDKSIGVMASESRKEQGYAERVANDMSSSWDKRFDEFLKGIVTVVDSGKPLDGTMNKISDTLGVFSKTTEELVKFLGGQGTATQVGNMVKGLTSSMGIPLPMANPIAGFAQDSIMSMFGQNDLFNLVANALSIFGVVKTAQKELKGFSFMRALGFAGGGYTGGNSKYKPAGIVHEGEWVAPQWMVEKYPDAIGTLEGIRHKGYYDGGGVGRKIPSRTSPYSYNRERLKSIESEEPVDVVLAGQIENNIKRIRELTQDYNTSVAKSSENDEKIAQLLEDIKNNTKPPFNTRGMIYPDTFTYQEDSVSQPVTTIPEKNPVELAKEKATAWYQSYTDKRNASDQEEMLKYFDVLANMPMEELYAVLDVINDITGVNQVGMTELVEIGNVLKQYFPGVEDWRAMSQFIQELVRTKSAEIQEYDNQIIKKLEPIFGMNERIDTIGKAMTDPRQLQNAVAGFTDVMGKTNSQLAGLFGAFSGLVLNTGVGMEMQEKLGELGYKNQVTDIISGFGLMLGGMSQNLQEQGSGISNLIMGAGSIAGGGWAAMATIAAPIIQGIFKRTKQEEQKEAEKIGNSRHFISTGDGFSPSERFYMSGRHAALLRSDSTPFSINVETNIDVQANSTMNTEDLSKEIGKQVNDQVSKALSDSLPRTYSRNSRRG